MTTSRPAEVQQHRQHAERTDVGAAQHHDVGGVVPADERSQRVRRDRCDLEIVDDAETSRRRHSQTPRFEVRDPQALSARRCTGCAGVHAVHAVPSGSTIARAVVTTGAPAIDSRSAASSRSCSAPWKNDPLVHANSTTSGRMSASITIAAWAESSIWARPAGVTAGRLIRVRSGRRRGHRAGAGDHPPPWCRWTARAHRCEVEQKQLRPDPARSSRTLPARARERFSQTATARSAEHPRAALCTSTWSTPAAARRREMAVWPP